MESNRIKTLLHNYIVIEPHKENIKESEGGLLLAEKHREDIRGRKATVKNAGINTQVVKQGDEIMYDRFSGFNLEVDDVIYLVIKESDVIVVLEQ
jgi:co-chaperonin GroES (HSP10)